MCLTVRNVNASTRLWQAAQQKSGNKILVFLEDKSDGSFFLSENHIAECQRRVIPVGESDCPRIFPTKLHYFGSQPNLTAGFTGEQTPSVPEPATLLLLGTGITGIAGKLRRRRKTKQVS